MEKLDSFHASNDDSFFGWTYTIAKNLISDVSRRRSAMALPFASGQDGDGASGSYIPSRDRRVSTVFARREWINTVLGRMKPKEADVIKLRHFKGLSFEEIAEKWEKSPGAVQRFYSRACQRFRELAKEYQGETDADD